ncbi:formyltetrahydrofolate deformylase [Sinomicrobium weinanense]|uniref:Formyltetrahydrofolate deformylase n=1 Tax=Sinomicrobium weinanense TaxID=2842200 RepID=A0A926JPX0_9FLAO|nr:formyltetrahydrofolate deformylase [Sinomicrobium weinanense]MBC9795196.1 formyltetrahydrofolate deformylase [Sinomicrobium weinanense]MBU3121973.1 formyltetrahydrofolate deformylase [Sinomicrobium weinanense]
MHKITLLISCKDTQGIIASVTRFIYGKNGNIVYIDQHVDMEHEVFFMRLESQFGESPGTLDDFKNEFSHTIAEKYSMSWEVHTDDHKPGMAVFVSKYDHCLYDLLGRYNSGELRVDIPFIISNHNDLRPVAENFGIPFHHIPVKRDNKEEAEAEQLKLLREAGVDFIVLARYMQIVSEKLINQYPHKIINIHHSFLPAFPGAKPYHSAFKRGVKIIGATSHYVTEELDAGPIIEQDITRVTHAHSIQDLVMKGRDLEKIVLARAVKLHISRKVMAHNNKTIVFS